MALSFLAAIAADAKHMAAQATPTASRTIGLSAFGAGTRDWTDYSRGGYGFLVGGDVTRGYRQLEPSLEIRYSHANGPAVTENTIEGGFKLAKALGAARRYHPYGELAAGYGTINYKFPQIFAQGPYTHDNAAMYGLGGGMDVDLTSRFSLKADFQHQFWKLGSETSDLTPSTVSVGVVYRIPTFSKHGPR